MASSENRQEQARFWDGIRAVDGTVCPSCGRADFGSPGAMKIHHKQAHGSSLVYELSVDCAECGAKIERPDNQMNRSSERNFCDKECYSAYYREGQMVECANCEAEFYVPPNRLENENVFCDRDCQYEYQRRGAASFRLEGANGYPRWVVESRTIHVHRLVAIANGAGPYKVFGDGSHNVDHKNGCGLDNRHENIQMLTVEKHGRKDGLRTPSGYSHQEMLAVVQFMLNPTAFLAGETPGVTSS